MSWLFSQALVEAYLPANCSGTEPSARLSVMASPQPFWRNGKTMDCYHFSQFGPTCSPLTADHGDTLLNACLEDSRARTSAAPVTELESTASAPDCGVSSRGWFAKLSLDASEWRIPQISLLEDSGSFCETWPRSGLMRGGTCFLLPTLAPTICVSASGSLLPTLTVSGNHNRPYPGKKSGYGLATALALLPTLTTIGLNSGSNSRAARERRGEPPTHVGPLNPDWAEWFMGFPTGWTAFGALEMPKFLEWQQQHGVF